MPDTLDDTEYLSFIKPIWQMWVATDKRYPPSWLLNEPVRLFWAVLQYDAMHTEVNKAKK